MSWVQDSSLALQVLTNIETYLVEEEIRMVKLDKNCKYSKKNYIHYFFKNIPVPVLSSVVNPDPDLDP
jgi:hypothetical protein